MFAYNGVTIPFCLTENHSSEAETDPSGTDVLYTKTSIRVRGAIYPGDFPHVQGEALPATIDRITHLLTTPRRRLTYTVGQSVMLDVLQDDANGPMPDSGAFTIQPLEGAFIVSVAYTVRLRRCDAAKGRGFLSLKWSDQETDDLRGNKTRRRSGMLIVGRSFSPNADDRRNLVIPLVPPGFRRESADYTLSEDGLRLRFVFVDKQLHRGVPFPAVRVIGSQVETIPREGGLRRGELSVRLEGRPGTNARDLLNAAIRIGMSRVYASGPQRDDGTGQILIGGGIRESLNDDETAVSLSLNWLIKPTPARLTGQQNPPPGGQIAGVEPGSGGTMFNAPGSGGIINNVTPEGRRQSALPLLAPWLGREFPDSSLAAGVPSTTRGTGYAAALRPMVEFLYDPCGQVGESELRAGRNGGSEWVGTGPGGAVVTVRTGEPWVDDRDGVPQDTAPGVWEEWSMTYTFTTDTCCRVAPSTVRGVPGEVVRFGNPEKKSFVKWSLKRTEGVPALPTNVIPKPGGYTGDGSSDDNWLLIKYARTFEDIDVAGDGVSFVYQAAGEAEFEALDSSKVVEGYPIPPWLVPSKRPNVANLSADAATGGFLPPGERLVGP